MIGAHIKGATRILGKAQGYLGLSVRDEMIHDKVNGPGTPSMTTAWEPTPAEMEAIARGALVHVRILGEVHPPIMVEVGEPPESKL